MSPVEIQLLPSTAGADAVLVSRLTDLVNRVYEVAEKGLWRDGSVRTTTGEMSELVRAGEIAVARMNDRIVGSVRVQRLPSGEGEFGMLATEPECRGAGIGRRLVEFTERLSRERGLATMQLELLMPQHWTHPFKDYLNGWYTRMGYRVVRIGSIDEAYPQLAPLLATPCDFRIYNKELVPAATGGSAVPAGG